MPKVPEYNLKPLKSLYNPGDGPATMKQKNLITVICEERKISVPNLSGVSARKATFIISELKSVVSKRQ